MTSIEAIGTDAIWAVLRRVLDPEIPVSIVDLGIVRSVDPVMVTITPTYVGCPAAEDIRSSIRAALDNAGFGAVALKTDLDPPWTTDWISDEGRGRLKAFGIAPPSSRIVACPQCGSTSTSEVSRSGSTLCKSLWRCHGCGEPFDLFKCH